MITRPRVSVSIPVGPARVYVSPSFTPNRSALRPAVQPAQRPQRPQRPAKTPRPVTPTRTPRQDAMRAIAAHERAIATIKRQHGAQAMPVQPSQPFRLMPTYGQPTTHTSTARPMAHYLCVALALVLGTVVVITAMVMGPRVTPRGVTVPATVVGVTAQHTTAAHTSAAHTAPSAHANGR